MIKAWLSIIAGMIIGLLLMGAKPVTTKNVTIEIHSATNLNGAWMLEDTLKLDVRGDETYYKMVITGIQ